MEASSGSGELKLEIVVFPWLAFGHMIPFLELSKRLAARGHAVAFVSTPRNIARLQPAHGVRFVALPLPRVDGLPEGAESTADVTSGNDELLKKAFDGLAAPFAAFLAEESARGRKPDWIVHDFSHHWMAPIAGQHKVPCAAFLIVYAGFVAFLGPRRANAAHPRTATEDFTVPPKWIPPPSAVAYRGHEAGWLAGAFRANASGLSDMDRTWRMFENSRLTIYRSCDEVDPGMFALLTNLLQHPAVPTGILLPPDITRREEKQKPPSESRHEALRWLDGQPPKSVIYVALGSEAPLTEKNLQELALGLELAGVRFLWALRKPAGIFSPEDDNGDKVLPAGFAGRTRGRGLVSAGWVPQVEALAHGATAAFLTHCGWGSTVESFGFGLPLVMLPFTVDQPLVARAMAEKGVGVEVARDERDGSFDRDGVAAAVRRVMVEDAGKVFARNARRLRDAVADQRRQEGYVDGLVEHLRRCRHD